MLDLLVKLMPTIVFVLYAVVAIIYIFKKDYPWALVWGSYAMANVGLILLGARDV